MFSPALAEKRVALVVGNDRYVNLPANRQLLKAVNDAESIGDAFASIGFDVIRGQNLGRQGIIDRLSELTARVGPGDTVALFYAGHGVAIGGVNYIVPSDVPAVTADAESRVRGASISEPDIIAEIQSKGVRVALLVLDACRDNPFPRTGTRSIGNTRGLADAKPVRGVFAIYSAGIGQTALDRLAENDKNRNSVFTRIFVREVTRPGLHLGDLAVEVREKVAELALLATNENGEKEPHEQTPAYYDQTIGGRVFLAGRSIAVEERKPDVPPPRVAPGPAVDDITWNFLKGSSDIASLRRFMTEFPSSPRAREAETRIITLERETVDARRKADDERQKVAVVAPPVVPAAPPTPVRPAVGVFTPPSDFNPLSPERERGLKPKDTFKECETCPEMVVVPAGRFTTGSPASEKNRNKDEGPQRTVTIGKPFAVGKFAVTFAEWDACMADGGCNGQKPSDQGWGRGNRPVVNVSWDDAKAYVAWLSRKTGKAYRLLSEAEREYAARAGSTTPFWWGSSISPSQANYNGNYTYGNSSKGEYRAKTVPVDSFQPNPFGLYQVHGNVWEWTEDCYHDSYAGAPSDGAAWTTGDCSRRVLRGGSWISLPGDLRAADRHWNAADVRYLSFGFRLARTLTPDS